MKALILGFCMLLATPMAFASDESYIDGALAEMTATQIESDVNCADATLVASNLEVRRRCTSDGQCRPGVEVCVGGECRFNSPQKPCRSDFECRPRFCLAGRCR